MEEQVIDSAQPNSVSSVNIKDEILCCAIASASSDLDMSNLVRLCDLAIHKKVVTDIAVDISHSEGFSKNARKIWVDFINDKEIRKVAFYGGDIYTETTVSFIVGAAGASDCKIFQTKDSALEWLSE